MPGSYGVRIGLQRSGLSCHYGVELLQVYGKARIRVTLVLKGVNLYNLLIELFSCLQAGVPEM
eukprot:1845236-Amphidinium_carterae.1